MIPTRRLSAATLLLLVLMATPAFAEWVVAHVSQPARYAVDGRSWRLLGVGMEVPNHAWIHTGRTGRLLLRRSDATIQFKPNTVAAISTRAEGSGEAVTILQKFGSILIDAEPRPDRRKSVETPYLAAIVRGTRFEVDVGRTSVALRVEEGVVEATHPTLGLRALVHPGQVALAQGHRRFAVRGSGPEPRIVPVEPREPRVAPARPAREPPRPAPPPSDDSEHEVSRAERDAWSGLGGEGPGDASDVPARPEPDAGDEPGGDGADDSDGEDGPRGGGADDAPEAGGGDGGAGDDGQDGGETGGDGAPEAPDAGGDVGGPGNVDEARARDGAPADATRFG